MHAHTDSDSPRTDTSDRRYGLSVSDQGTVDARAIFPAQSSVIDERALFRHIVPLYDLPQQAIDCLFFDRGDADIYRIRAEHAAFYMKVYRPPYSREQVESEAFLVRDLAALEVPVVEPIPRKDGHFVASVEASEGTRPILLFNEAPAGTAKAAISGSAETWGHAVAQLHDTMDRLERDYALPVLDTDMVLHDVAAFSEPYLGGSARTTLLTLLDRLRQQLSRFPMSRPDYGLCHADLVLSNVRYNASGNFVFFDFGNAGYTWRARELAIVFTSLHRNDVQTTGTSLWDSFLAGYRDQRELPGDFDSQLNSFILLRKVSWLFGVMATCPLRMGTNTFNNTWVENQMGDIEALVDRVDW